MLEVGSGGGEGGGVGEGGGGGGGGGEVDKGGEKVRISSYKVNISWEGSVQPGGYSYSYCPAYLKVAKRVILKFSSQGKKCS